MGLVKRIEGISTLKEKCFDGNDHELELFQYNNTKSEFIDICARAGCGQYQIDSRSINTYIGLMHFVDSDEYHTLLKKSEEIRKAVNVDG